MRTAPLIIRIDPLKGPPNPLIDPVKAPLIDPLKAPLIDPLKPLPSDPLKPPLIDALKTLPSLPIDPFKRQYCNQIIVITIEA